MRMLAITLAVFMLLAARPAAAHHNWLQLLPPKISGDAGLLVACFGHRLPLGDSPPALADYDELVLISPRAERRQVTKLVPLGIPAVVAVELPESGLWCAAGWREHYGSQTTEGYQRGHRRDVEAQGFKVLECKHTFRYGKTYAKVGGAGKPAVLRVGHTLELVPQASIADLQTGGVLELTVLFEGEPQAGMVVSGTPAVGSEELAHPDEQEKFRVSGITGAGGRVSFPVEEPGQWFFIAEQVVDDPEPGVDKLYRSAVLTLSVGTK